MSPIEGGRLNDADRMTLISVLDRLIPPVDELPGAGGMGLAREIELRARRNRGLRTSLTAVMDALSLDLNAHAAGGFQALEEEIQDEALRQVERSMPEHFGPVLQLAYTLYYMQAPVQERIGWAGAVQPGGFEIEPFEESLLQNVRRREPFWRNTG